MKSMRNNLLKNIAVIFLILFAAGCSMADNTFNLENNSDNSMNDYYVSEKQAVLKISLDDNAKTAMPLLSTSDLTNFRFTATKKSDDSIYTNLSFNTYEELQKATIGLTEDEYNFTLVAYYDNIMYAATKVFTVTLGLNRVSFELCCLGNFGHTEGKGNFDILLKCSNLSENVMVVKAGLYTLSGLALGTEKEIAKKGYFSDTVEYKNDEPVAAGSYVAKFMFYADDECKCLLGTFQEYVLVAKDKTSYSEPEYSGLVDYCSVNYHNLGVYGNFKQTDKPVSSFTRYSGNIDIPAPEGNNSKNEFDGWYTDSEFKSDRITTINCAEAKNVDLYAKWKIGKTITFDGNSRKFYQGTAKEVSAVTEDVKGVDEKSVVLPTAASLGLSTKGGAFFGWSTDKWNTDNFYSDGAQVELKGDNITLYAIFSKAIVNPDDKSTTDTDGDGITDYNELYTYHTDPSEKDTDGDGFSDGYERNLISKGLNEFNPVIADFPKLEVEIGDVSKIQIVRNYTEAASKTSGTSQTQSETYQNSVAKTSSKTSSSSETHGWKVGLEFAWTTATTGPSFSKKLSLEYNGNKTTGSSATFSNASTQTWGKTVSNGKTYTEGKTQTNNGGKVIVPVVLTNNGYIAYSINSLTLGLYAISKTGREECKFIASKKLENISMTEFNKPKEVEVSFDDLTNQQFEELVLNSKGFSLIVENYSYSAPIDGSKFDFTESITKTNAKCADLSISFGTKSEKPCIDYKISVKAKYNVFAGPNDELYDNVTLREFLAYAGIKEEDPVSEDYRLTLNNGMIKGIGSTISNGSSKDGDWYMMIYHINANHEYTTEFFTSHSVGRSEVNEHYNIDEIIIKPQDRVKIFYDIDNDEDGVCYDEEVEYGTDDTKIDSDGDGLTDYEEIYGFTKKDINGNVVKDSDGNPIIYRTDPASVDTDGDADEHPGDDPAKWNDKNDPDPVTPEYANIAEIKTLSYASSDESNYVQVTENALGIFEIDSENLQDYLYLKIVPKYKNVSLFVSKMNIDGTPYQKDGDYVYEKVNGFNPKILLAPRVENNIKIKLVTNSGENSSEYTVKCIKPSVFAKFADYGKFTLSSQNKNSFTVSLPSTKDARLNGNVSEELIGVNEIGYLLAVSAKTPVSDPSFTGDKIPYYDRENHSTVNDTLKDSEKWQYFAFKINGLNEGYQIDLERYSSEICYRWFAFIEKNNTNTIIPLTDKTERFQMHKPSKGKLTFTIDGIKAIIDCDGGSSPEYYGSFKVEPNYFKDADTFKFEAGKINAKRSDAKYWSFKDGSAVGYVPIKGTGLAFTTDPIQLKTLNDGQEITIKLLVKEHDHGRYDSDDTVGTINVSLIYNADKSTWSIKEFVGNQSVIANYKDVVILGEDGYSFAFMYRNDDEGHLDVLCSIAWDCVWDIN